MKYLEPNMHALQQLSLSDEIAILTYCSGVIQGLTQEHEVLSMMESQGPLLIPQQTRLNKIKNELEKFSIIGNFHEGRVDEFMNGLYEIKERE